MGAAIDYRRAREFLVDALAIAQSDDALPQEWMDVVATVSESPSKTYVAVYGTILLAHATNPNVDVLALKATADSPGAYAPRLLCQRVLVPFAVDNAVHLGVRGPEPFNNQPWFRYDFVSADMRVAPQSRPALAYLIEVLERVRSLSPRDSLLALAAFLRVRREYETAITRLVDIKAMGLPAIVEHATEFVNDNAEGGRRGQALAAAALDLVFADLRTSRVNDPSRHVPGDLQAFDDDDVLLLSAEVRQKVVGRVEALQFALRLERHGRRAMVIALSLDQAALPRTELAAQAAARSGVLLTVLEGVDELLRTALAWSTAPLEAALQLFVRQVAVRLQEVEASEAALEQWARRMGGRLKE